ncbi:MAG: uncharacterized protein PWQ82_130 [Thermosediminibacterales bacterium]|nr:uncharacterized protein [Thermosediminibacterales bacterium]
MKRFTYFVIGIVVAVIAIIFMFGNLYLEWLWFGALGYSRVFITMIASQWGIRIISWAIYFLFILANLLMIKGAVRDFLNRESSDDKIINLPYQRPDLTRRLNIIFIIASAVLAFMFSSYTGSYWLTIQQFFNKASFGYEDPIFNKDVGFYVFNLPFYQIFYQYLISMFALTFIAVTAIYFLSNPPRRSEKGFILLPKGQKHVSILLALVLLTKAWGYRLDAYRLLYSPRGVAFGASYTDIHAQLPGLRILMFIALLLAGLLILNMFIKRAKLIVYTLAVFLIASVLLGNVYPGLIQKFQVEPNEFNKEKPYIEYNIKFTQKGYGLDKIESKIFPAEDGLTFEDIKEASGTLNNVRLWDYRPLKQTYSQLQEIRPYYKFKQIDTDRYIINGVYRQVMLAARELDQTKLSERAQTWVNKRLQYTHGYGIAMSPVNEITTEGLPRLFIKNIPPRSEIDIEVKRPEIYYGELTDEYVIVKTTTKEFDYPKGGTNAYTTYEGKGGVPLGSIGRRLLYALKFGDYKMLLSGSLTSESRIMYDRNIKRRISKIAPFLKYDRDPYLVINEGRLFWIQDAYTVTDMFPYSEPYQGINYIRNPIKVVVDAYNGDVKFYLIEPEEPIAKSLSGVFPTLFRSIDEMPEGIRPHIRYPEDLFTIQAGIYTIYHMNDPKVFYNKEDQWQIPNEVFAGETQPVEPYYTIIQLPGEQEPEYVLMQPYSPITKNVMISWMAGRSDGDNYGKLVVYLFPKEKLVYGPSQIEAKIDQNSQISQQLTLWNQRGSSVIRGNLLVLPIKNSIMYVEPIFLQAEQSQLPELIRVIVAYGDNVVMERSLGEALSRIFGAEAPPIEVTPPPKELPPEEPRTIKELINKANELFNTAQDRQRVGDWAGYGDALKQLEEVLRQLQDAAK